MPKTKTPTAPPPGTQSMASFATVTKSPKPPKAPATEEHSGPSMKEILDERDRKYKSLIVLWAAAEFLKQHAHRMSCQDRWTQGVHHFARAESGPPANHAAHHPLWCSRPHCTPQIGA